MSYYKHQSLILYIHVDRTSHPIPNTYTLFCDQKIYYIYHNDYKWLQVMVYDEEKYLINNQNLPNFN